MLFLSPIHDLSLLMLKQASFHFILTHYALISNFSLFLPCAWYTLLMSPSLKPTFLIQYVMPLLLHSHVNSSNSLIKISIFLFVRYTSLSNLHIFIHSIISILIPHFQLLYIFNRFHPVLIYFLFLNLWYINLFLLTTFLIFRFNLYLFLIQF